MTALPDLISKKFRFWSFVTILTVVLSHSYNLNLRYLQPWTTPNEALTWTSFTEYFFANGFFRFTMPLLFAISGYLYAMKDAQPNKLRIKRRFHTLFIPYLIWSAEGMIMVYILEMFPYTRALISNCHIAQLDNTTMLLHQYKWYFIILRALLAPISYQLWFIWVLFIYNLAYKPICWCVMHSTGKWIFFSIVTLMWLATFGIGIVEGEGLLFFSLGIWLQKNKFNIEVPARWLNPLWWGAVWLILTVGKTWLAFKGTPYLGGNIYPVLAIMMKLSVLTGLVAVWYSSNSLAQYFMKKKWFTSASNYSFFIYGAHAPLVAILIDAVFSMLHYTNHFRLISFILLPAMLVIGFIVIGYILKLIVPKVFAVMTGERGI